MVYPPVRYKAYIKPGDVTRMFPDDHGPSERCRNGRQWSERDKRTNTCDAIFRICLAFRPIPDVLNSSGGFRCNHGGNVGKNVKTAHVYSNSTVLQELRQAHYNDKRVTYQPLP